MKRKDLKEDVKLDECDCLIASKSNNILNNDTTKFQLLNDVIISENKVDVVKPITADQVLGVFSIKKNFFIKIILMYFRRKKYLCYFYMGSNGYVMGIFCNANNGKCISLLRTMQYQHKLCCKKRIYKL